MEDFVFPICPKCEHESTRLNANFCSACGAPLENKCTNRCGEGPFDVRRLDPHDEYCYQCGAESLFKQEGLLD